MAARLFRDRRDAGQARAVEPLERTARREEGEAPETYPFAV